MSKKIQLIIGSTREGRISPALVPWIQVQAATNKNIELEVVDLKEINLPFFNEPESPMNKHAQAPEAIAWGKKVAEADGYIFLTSEYNRGYPASLKNAIDFLYNEWLEKPAAIVSYGWIDGGTNANKQLRDVLGWLKMPVAEEYVTVHFNGEAFGENGLKPEFLAQYEGSLQSALSHF